MFEALVQEGDRTAATELVPDGIDRGATAPPAAKVLVIDSDRDLRVTIIRYLETHGHFVLEADSGPAARAILSGVSPDVVVLDVLVPGEDGLAIVRDLSVRAEVSVIVLSTLASEMDRIIGLEAGADDYLAKPVSMRELLARIRAVRRRRAKSARAGETSALCYRFSGWSLDVERRALLDPARIPVNLSDGEFAVLRAFVERAQRVLTRDQLLEFARGPDSDAFDRAIDTQISRIRRKLGGRSRDDLIRTVRSEGYMFVPKVDLA